MDGRSRGAAVIEVRPGADRAITRTPGITTRHTFSSGAHYDPGNTHFGLLVAHDEHWLEPGAGFEIHAHRGLEIVTWVIDGTLLHEDSMGGRSTVRHGMVQYLSAGSGIEHAERNAGDTELRFVQMWLLGGRGTPRYEIARTKTLHLPGAALHVVTLDDEAAQLPDARFVHVFVATGRVAVDVAGPLATGDAARLGGGGGASMRGTGEVLLLEMNADATSSPAEPGR